MTAIVYRNIPGRPRQYLRRIAGPALYLWHADRALALALDAKRATRLVAWFNRSCHFDRYWTNFQPKGEYGTEAL